MLQYVESKPIVLLLCVTLAFGVMGSNNQAIKTIKTEDGDIFKCIDINQQPALGHPLLKNHEIQIKPSAYPSKLSNMYLLEVNNSMAQLPSIPCPRGSIPILQDNNGGKIDKLRFHTMAKTGKGEMAGVKIIDDIYGSQVSINVYEPKVKEKTKDFSASWVEMHNDQNKSQLETIAVGSIVWPSFHGDNFARFHIVWFGKNGNECWDHLCPGFVQVSQSVGLGGRVKPVSIYNGPQHEINILLFKDPKTKNWWLSYGKERTPIGYWPSLLFDDLSDKSNLAFWGGHVSGPTVQSNFPEMGSGHYPSEGFGKAAFVRHIQIVDENNRYAIPNIQKTFPGSTKETCYPVEKFGQNEYGIHAYYGGPGGCNN